MKLKIKKRKEEVETRNNADSLVFQAEKVIKDLGDKADANTVAKVKDGIEGVKNALKGTDIEQSKKLWKNYKNLFMN